MNLTDEDQKYIQKRPSRQGGYLYADPILQQFQLWLRRNAINAGGQRTEGSIIKQEIHDIVDNSGYKYTKEDICSICNVDERTFRRFFEEARLDTTVQPKIITDQDFISVGSFEHFAPQELTERDFISVGLIYIGYSNE